MMKKRTKRAAVRAARKEERGAPGKGRSKYALRAAAGPSSTSPFRSAEPEPTVRRITGIDYEVTTPAGITLVGKRENLAGYPGFVWLVTEPSGSWHVEKSLTEALRSLGVQR